jgi:hypothetical protein
MRTVSLALFVVSLVWSAALAQQPELSNLSVAERDRWQADIVNILGENWYFRVTVGALADLYPTLSQPTGFAHLTLGLSWTPAWLLTPWLQVTKAVHEIGLSLEGVGKEPKWAFEIIPLVIEFEINPRSSAARASASLPAQPVAQPEQQASLDLKALVLARLDDLIKASEQTAKDLKMDVATLTDPLKEFKKHFEASKLVDAALQLNAYSSILRVLRKFGVLKEYDEAHLRTGLHRLMAAVALFNERTQPPPAPVPMKICTGLYQSADKKTEEVISPFLIEALKKFTFTNTQTGAKETLDLKESKCF